MKILVTGATGFTGPYVVRILIERGHDVRCPVRASSDRSVLPGKGIEWVEGDLGDFEALKRALAGTDALLNVTSMGFGHGPTIVGAALTSGVQRALFLSTTAMFTTLNAPSKTVRLAAEKEIRHLIMRMPRGISRTPRAPSGKALSWS